MSFYGVFICFKVTFKSLIIIKFCLFVWAALTSTAAVVCSIPIARSGRGQCKLARRRCVCVGIRKYMYIHMCASVLFCRHIFLCTYMCSSACVCVCACVLFHESFRAYAPRKGGAVARFLESEISRGFDMDVRLSHAIRFY